MDLLVDFLASPWALPALFAIIFLFPLIAYLSNLAKRNAILQGYFKGTHSFFRIDLLVSYEGYRFHLTEEGTGRITSRPLGIIPALWAVVDAPATFLCASTQATRNSFGWKLWEYACRKDVVVGEDSVFIGAGAEEFQGKLENILKSGSEAARRIVSRLLNDAESFQVKEVIFVGGKGFFTKKRIFRYSGFPATIYSNPNLLEAQLKDMVALLRELGIKPAEG